MAFHRLLPKSLALASSSSFLSRSFFTSSRIHSSPSADRCLLSLIRRLRPLAVVADSLRVSASPAGRSLSTSAASSSLNDPDSNCSDRPPKDMFFPGCDLEHWLVVMEKPEGEPTRDEIIDSYIKTLALVVGSEEEARMKIYSVSTRRYFGFGAQVSEELSEKIEELPRVLFVLPDSYQDVENKDYGGEPFINGQAGPYDPKYHEEWKRNNARAKERNSPNDRPDNFDSSRNSERRGENMQNRDDFQNPSPVMQNPGPNIYAKTYINSLYINMGGGVPLNNMKKKQR